MAKFLKELEDLGTKPNWVSTRAKDSSHKMDAWVMQGSADETKKRIKAAVAKYRGSKLVNEGPIYLEYEFTTLILRFVDDVSFVLDPGTKTVHYCSVSRVGHSDLGANRKRMTEIAATYSSR